ncbi:hypothetical protein [Rhodococcus sp. (in: high G+C Gram-positive bacteria)]|uniref:hypothetical protein n=1 Tax=Rhodococcus sp. TaxID=1831 RepID=UPI003B8A7F14
MSVIASEATASSSPILTMIIACEIGFWVLVIGGLTVRYLLRLRRTSTVMLSLLPVLDVLLLIVVAIDIHGGGEIGSAHRLVGIYLGWTVMFAHSTVRALDVRFAHKFAGGPPPVKRPKSGPEAFAHEMRAWLKWLCAAAIALAVTFGLAATVANPEQAEQLRATVMPVGIITVGWLLFGPLWVNSRSDNSSNSSPRERINRE